MSSKTVSIIMRSKNSDWVINSALAALFAQDFQNFELIIVDSGSTDSTLDIIKNYPCKLVQIAAGDYYPGKVLNDAIKLTNSELIVFVNSDSVMLSPKSLSSLLSPFEDKAISATFGRQLPRPEADTWVKRDYAASFPETGDTPDWITLSLPLAAFRRSTWEKHPFYTDAWASEDSEWGHWAQRNGYQVKYVPTASTMHSHNYTHKEIYGRRFVEGEADVFIYNKRPNAYRSLLSLFRSYIQDIPEHIKSQDWLGLCALFSRRLVYHWAYFKGTCVGYKRIKLNNTDSSYGQNIVLRSTVK